MVFPRHDLPEVHCLGNNIVSQQCELCGKEGQFAAGFDSWQSCMNVNCLLNSRLDMLSLQTDIESGFMAR